MDLGYGSEKSHKFITNVGLISSNGSIGYNVMAAEWTHHVSYKPGVIAVCINSHNQASLKNIRETKEFGVSIASVKQTGISSISGNNSGSEINKIDALKELGYELYKAKTIDVMMVKNSSLNAECKVIQEIPAGSHEMFLGEVNAVQISDEEPLAYHKGNYWKITEQLEKPSEKELQKIQKIIEKHKK